MDPMGSSSLALLALLGAGLTAPLPATATSHGAPAVHASPPEAGHKLKRAKRSVADYALPAVQLVRDDGKAVVLPGELDDGRPVVLNFIFTACGSICPVMSQTFSLLQEKLGEARSKVHLVSISIDPEQDTPARLTEYARRFKAGPGWRYYTGTLEASVALQRAFDVYRGDKMNHTPVTFLRAGPGRRWVRIDGFASSDELADECRDLLAAR